MANIDTSIVSLITYRRVRFFNVFRFCFLVVVILPKKDLRVVLIVLKTCLKIVDFPINIARAVILYTFVEDLSLAALVKIMHDRIQ